MRQAVERADPGIADEISDVTDSPSASCDCYRATTSSDKPRRDSAVSTARGTPTSKAASTVRRSGNSSPPSSTPASPVPASLVGADRLGTDDSGLRIGGP